MKTNIQRKAAQRTFANTKSFQALMTLYTEVLEGTTSTDKYIAPSALDLSDFRNWFSNLVIEMPEHFGVSWLHCFGKVTVQESAKQVRSVNQDNQLDDFVETMNTLGDRGEDESEKSKYLYMLVQAWTSLAKSDAYFAKRDEYHCRLHEILTQQALAESITAFSSIGLSKSNTLEFIEASTAQMLGS